MLMAGIPRAWDSTQVQTLTRAAQADAHRSHSIRIERPQVLLQAARQTQVADDKHELMRSSAVSHYCKIAMKRHAWASVKSKSMHQGHSSQSGDLVILPDHGSVRQSTLSSCSVGVAITVTDFYASG